MKRVSGVLFAAGMVAISGPASAAHWSGLSWTEATRAPIDGEPNYNDCWYLWEHPDPCDGVREDVQDSGKPLDLVTELTPPTGRYRSFAKATAQDIATGGSGEPVSAPYDFNSSTAAQAETNYIVRGTGGTLVVRLDFSGSWDVAGLDSAQEEYSQVEISARISVRQGTEDGYYGGGSAHGGSRWGGSLSGSLAEIFEVEFDVAPNQRFSVVADLGSRLWYIPERGSAEIRGSWSFHGSEGVIVAPVPLPLPGALLAGSLLPVWLLRRRRMPS